MNIEDLVNKYFEGETTCEEERELRRYFTSEDVPKGLQAYRPIFAYFEEEAKQNKQSRTEGKNKNIKQRLIYAFSGMAAGILLAIGIATLYQQYDTTPSNYVIIDGKKYTDASLVHQQAQAAFRDVSLSKDDVFATLFSE
jgi:hypothetical protein